MSLWFFYMRIKITPEYLASQGLSSTFQERFWSKVIKNGPTHPYHPELLGNCWEWSGYISSVGYGQISRGKHNGKHIGTHVAAWILTFGTVPEGWDVCHSCDRRYCVNPSHLFSGSRSDNMQDSIAKGRAPIGERNGLARFTFKEVENIRAQFPIARMSQSKFAKSLGIPQQNLSRILLGKTYARTTATLSLC